MNITTAVFLQHANDILTELMNDPKLGYNRADLLLISEKFNTLNKRLNRIYQQRYANTINTICDNTLNDVHTAFIISQQYLITKVKYEYITQAAKSIQLGTFLNYSQAIYEKTSKDKTFTNDIEEIIEDSDRFYKGFDCQLNKKEVLTNIDMVEPIYIKMLKQVQKSIKH